MQTYQLATNQTATGFGRDTLSITSNSSVKTFQVTGTTTSGTGACSVDIQASNDLIGWLTIGNVTLSLGTSVATDGFVIDAPWAAFRCNVLSISGTGAKVTVTAGV